MSQQNVEVVRRVTDLMDAEDYEAALPIFSKPPTRTRNGGKIRLGPAPERAGGQPVGTLRAVRRAAPGPRL
jgi:hypothetical protein